MVAAAAVGVSLVVTTLVGSDAPAEAMAPPRFVEEADPAGIDHVYDGDFTFFVGGGVAVFDCNADARPDLFFAGGTNPASLYRNESLPGGELQFSEVADAATELTEVTGAYPVNIDGDSHTDLVVLRLGENVLLRGLGQCRFERANEQWGFDGGDQWTAAFSATWEQPGGLPTLAFGNYVELDDAGRQFVGCSDNVLVRPDGEQFAAALPLAPGLCTLSILFSDWDRSGGSDLRVTNDRHYYRDGEEQLWHIVAGEPPRLYTRDEGWRRMEIWGMGIASHDVTGDGLPEVFLTSQGDNKLQALTDGPARPSYSDIAIRRGVTAHRPFTGDDVLPSTAWHAEFDDVNNDGFIDLFIAKGNVEAMAEFAAEDPNNLLLGQADGTFMESAEAAGIVDFARTRGASLVDLNLDGMLDLVEVNRRQPVKLWRNVGWGDAAQPAAMGNWVAVDLEQVGPNPDAIGAWVELRIGDRVVTREVTVGGGHAGGEVGWIHFGLGEARAAEVRVEWPDGDLGPWQRIDANQFAIIERGAARVLPWQPTEE
jgi:hypothetical protein